MAEPIPIAELSCIFSSLRRGDILYLLSSCLALDGINSIVFRFPYCPRVYKAEKKYQLKLTNQAFLQFSLSNCKLKLFITNCILLVYFTSVMLPAATFLFGFCLEIVGSRHAHKYPWFCFLM